MMKLILSSDHAGFHYKQALLVFLKEQGYEVTDGGPLSGDSVDYPHFIIPAAKRVASGEFERGIVLGGSGNGEAMAANKVLGIRCAVVWNHDTARFAAQHNDANIISFGERVVSLETAKEAAMIWLTTPFEAGRHQRRIDQLATYEQTGNIE